MKIIPFRSEKRDEKPKLSTIRYNRFDPPKSLADYGFDGSKPIKDSRSSSGFVLPWIAIDAERDRRVSGGHCELVVVGEWVDDSNGIRSPNVAVNPAWMEGRGYVRESITTNGRKSWGPWSRA